MKCIGCYKEENMPKNSYCRNCRKVLFDGIDIETILGFDKPAMDTFAREHVGRFSISGVQDKISLHLGRKARRLEMTDVSGEYILKPIPSESIQSKEILPENEHLTMQIAKQVFKINTAQNALIYFTNGEMAYITKRFDREKDTRKKRQEDFCQLLGKTKETEGDNYKYNGYYADAKAIFEQFVSAKQLELEKFFKIIVFNYVFCNGDAHFKNFSLLEDANDSSQMILSPAYDLVNTRLHIPNDSALALDGLYKGDMDEYPYSDNGFYSRFQFLELAKKLNINPQRTKKIIDEFLATFDKVDNIVKLSFLPADDKTKYMALYADKLKALNNTRGCDGSHI